MPKSNLAAILAIFALSGCLTEADDAGPLGTTDQAVVGQQSIDYFTTAFNTLAAAGVALPTATETIDLGTCDLTDPVEPAWNDRFGGAGYRYWDPFKRIYRTYTAARVGDLHSTAATIKLRINFLSNTTTATGSGRIAQIAYLRDAANNPVEDWDAHYTPDGRLDRVLTSQDLGPTTSTTATTTSRVATFTVTVGNKLTWAIPCGSIQMRGTVRFDRPLHVGSVKIAAFPVGILYEPNFPPGDRSFGKGTQEVAATIGTSFSTAVRNEGTGQDFSADASSLWQAKETLTHLGSVLSKKPFAEAADVGGILSALASGLGTDTTSIFSGNTDDRGASLTETLTATEKRVTNYMPGVVPAGETGLGKGDFLCWLRNVTFGYVWSDGYLRMIPVAYEESRCDIAFRVRDQIATLRLRATCIFYPPFNRPAFCTRQPGEIPGSLADLEQLAAIDPFIADPLFRPESDPARFQQCQPMSEPAYEYSWKLANTGTSSMGNAYWTSRTVVQTPGWLSIIGIGPLEPTNTSIKTTHTALRTTTTGLSIGTGFILFRNGDSQPFVRCLDTAFAAALAAPPVPVP